MASNPGGIGKSAWSFQTSASLPPTGSQRPISASSASRTHVPPLHIVNGPIQAAPRPQPDECLPRSCVAPAVRGLFSFEFFNRMQSKCFPALYDSWDNCVIGAPTAAGKTVCFELAIASYLNLKSNPRTPQLAASESSSAPTSINATGNFPKAILYLAPLKSLVQERLKEWRTKLHPLGIACQELSGDLNDGSVLAPNNSSVLYLSTPERWDSITRRWQDNAKSLDLIGLILVDEVHLLGDDRGAVLEAVVARTMMLSTGRPPRIIALSASSPNVEDIGQWLNSPPNCIFKFGEEHRPITPKLHVLGYNPGKSDFFFDKMLDARLWSVIQQYGEKKPTLVFVSNRKATASAASKLLDSCSENGSSYVTNAEQRARLLEAAGKVINDPQLSGCILSGIGYHHAAMAPENRLLVESLFATGKDLMVVVATSTLAVGVNLPAYLVIIKSTSYWTQSTGVCECNPIQIRQMIGRAGRPQFGDSSAAAVVMTQQTKVATYESILECDTAVTESNLHKHLTDTLLNEICLGSISSLKDALAYLQHTFLAVRMRSNHQYYTSKDVIPPSNATQAQNSTTPTNRVAPLPPSNVIPSASSASIPSSGSPIHPFLRHLCMKSLASLKEFELITMLPQNQSLNITELGLCMSRYFISFESIQALFTSFPPNEAGETYGDISTRRLLEVVCSSPQYSQTLVRRAEKKELREVSAQTRFPVKPKGIMKAEKVSILLQSLMLRSPSTAGSGTSNFTDISLNAEVETCATTAVSILHCAIQFFIDRGWFYAVHKAILLLKSIKKRCWINGSYQTTQIPPITSDIAKRLETSGIRTLLDLKNLPTDDLSQCLNNKPAFAQNVTLRLQQVPHYALTAQLAQSPGGSRSQLPMPASASSTSNNNKVLKIVIQHGDQARSGSRDKYDRWLLILGQAGRLLYSRPLTLNYYTEEATILHVALPEHTHNGALELVLASEEWIGLDLVGTVSLETTEIQSLTPQNEFQDPYNEDSTQKNAKKRKAPTSVAQVVAASTAPPHQAPAASSQAPCQHKCKNKFTCKHDCCKLHPEVHTSGRTQIELPAPRASVTSSMSHQRDSAAQDILPTAKRPVSQIAPRSEPAPATKKFATFAAPSPSSVAPHAAPGSTHSNTHQASLPQHPMAEVRVHAPQPTRTNTLSTSVYRSAHLPPNSPRSVSPLPRTLFMNPPSEVLDAPHPTPSVVTTRPGRNASFLPSIANFTHQSSVPTNPIAPNQQPSTLKFTRPTLRPGAKPSSEILSAHPRQGQAATTSSSSNQAPQLAAHLPTASKRTQNSILAPPSPSSRFGSSPLAVPLRSPQPSRTTLQATQAKQPPSGWKTFLDWELSLGLQPEP